MHGAGHSADTGGVEPGETDPRSTGRGELLGEGAFSRVYREVDPVHGRQQAVKVAKEVDEAGARGVPTNCVPTEAFAWATGWPRDVSPDTGALLRAQHRALERMFSTDLVQVRGFPAGSTWFSMELVEGCTLRRVLESGEGGQEFTAPGEPRLPRLTIELADCLRRLEQGGFPYHGDLKPENVLVSGTRLVLIDPGYAGPLQTAGGSIDECVVTTPSYYPWLDPRDDLLAFGLMIWELLLGVQPLRWPEADVPGDRRIGQELAELCSQAPYARFFAPLRSVPLPRELDPTIAPQLEAILLQALRLRLEAGVLDRGPGFRTFADVCEALAPYLGLPARPPLVQPPSSTRAG